jgi:hypothetical protein
MKHIRAGTSHCACWLELLIFFLAHCAPTLCRCLGLCLFTQVSVLHIQDAGWCGCSFVTRGSQESGSYQQLEINWIELDRWELGFDTDPLSCWSDSPLCQTYVYKNDMFIVWVIVVCLHLENFLCLYYEILYFLYFVFCNIFWDFFLRTWLHMFLLLFHLSRLGIKTIKFIMLVYKYIYKNRRMVLNGETIPMNYNYLFPCALVQVTTIRHFFLCCTRGKRIQIHLIRLHV